MLSSTWQRILSNIKMKRTDFTNFYNRKVMYLLEYRKIYIREEVLLQHIDLYKKIKCRSLIHTASINGINVSSKN